MTLNLWQIIRDQLRTPEGDTAASMDQIPKYIPTRFTKDPSS